MFEYLYEWVENLAFYMILSTIFLEAPLANSYQKYIRFFTGIILVLLLAKPILKVFGMEHSFFDVMDGSAYEREMRKIEEKTEYLRDVSIEDYRKKVEEMTNESEDGMEGDER